MNIDDFRNNAAFIDLETGWEIFGLIIQNNPPPMEHLLEALKEIKKKNPSLGNLLLMEAKLNVCLDEDTPNERLLKTLNDFRELETMFNGAEPENDSQAEEKELALDIIEALKSEYPEILSLMEDNIASA